jgi:hypothetical protein
MTGIPKIRETDPEHVIARAPLRTLWTGDNPVNADSGETIDPYGEDVVLPHGDEGETDDAEDAEDEQDDVAAEESALHVVGE